MSRLLLRLVLAILVLSVLAAPASARRKSETSTAPGKYTDWNGEVDELEVVQAFRLADYSKMNRNLLTIGQDLAGVLKAF
ncbi:MAG TPA: hypothetical protein VGR07_08200 [Thermoanaerobaculia bacterium]|jgi:opacity protein-like surface antigen|nr:hypothetical protein [Thermoanaerobaculia bacterium]